MAVMLLTAGFLTSCGQKQEQSALMTEQAADREPQLHIVLTNRDTKEQLFTIDESICSLAEGRLYLYNLQNRYQKVYGDAVWQRKTDTGVLEDELRSMALSRLVRVKTMALLATERGIQLDKKDEQLIREAASAYYDGISEKAKEELRIDPDTLEGCYRDLTLADRVYRQIIAETEPEISDDEARCVTVSQIFFRTVEADHNGGLKEMDQSAKKEIYQKALSILARLNQGEDFEQLAAVNNEADKITISFGKGEVDPALEEAAFSMGEGELSRIVETEEGYVILKCIQSFDREQTDLRKEQIAARRKEEAFTRIYEDFSQNKVRRLYEEKWEKIPLSRQISEEDENFFSVYESLTEGL